MRNIKATSLTLALTSDRSTEILSFMKENKITAFDNIPEVEVN